MKTSEVLRTARQNLPGHWYQGYYGDGEGNYCALGHLSVAAGLNPRTIVTTALNDGDFSVYNDDVHAAYTVLQNVIVEQYPHGPREIPIWNDDLNRTEDEVIAMFDKAILEAEAREAQE